MPQEQLSLQHWRAFLSSSAWLGSIWQSLWIATVSTVARRDRGHALRRRLLAHRLGLSEKVRGLMILPMAVPTIVYALGLYRLYVDLDLVGTGSASCWPIA